MTSLHQQQEAARLEWRQYHPDYPESEALFLDSLISRTREETLAEVEARLPELGLHSYSEEMVIGLLKTLHEGISGKGEGV